MGLVVLAALQLASSRAHAHEPPEPPRPLEVVDGTWPPGPVPTHDVVVQLLVTVTETGEVEAPKVDVTLSAELDAAAITAALRWRFAPARRAGVPIASHVRIAVRFRAPPPVVPHTPEPPAPPPPVVDTTSAPARSLEPTPASEQGFGATARIEAAARTASEVTRDRKALSAAPHRTGNDLLAMAPGAFVTQHSGEGKASQIFYRGFDAVHGQDLEIWVGGAPVNDVSNLHGQGYADVHFVMPEVVRSLRITPGTYDPRQGDFAVAGTMRFELGYDQPGLTAKAGYGSFGSSRYFLAYRPKQSTDRTFAAAEFYKTDGFGPSRAAQRASAIAQSVWRVGSDSEARLLVSAYTGHFDSAGVVRLSDVESGALSRFDTYDPQQGGHSSRVQLVGEIERKTDDATFSVAPYVVLRALRLRQNFTGYLSDPSGDSQQQRNDALTVGGTAFYRLRQRIFSAHDQLEAGVLVRSDWVDQSQRRLATTDQRVTAEQVDATIRALDVGGYLDVALHPLSMVTVRGGLRIDGLSYLSDDRGADASGQARASQGAHFGKKASVEVRLVRGLSAIGSYGEGFRSPQARSLAESETTPFTRVMSTEGGLRFASDTLTASAAFFRTWLSDDLVFDQTTVRNELVPATRRTGGTLEATYRPLPWINLSLNTTYTRSEFRQTARGYTKGDLVPYAPQLVSRADLSVTPVLGSWRNRSLRAELGTGLSSLARRPLPYAQRGHDIFLVDAQARLRWGEVALAVSAFNLLDASWYDGEFLFPSNWQPDQGGASLVPTRHVTLGAPRTFFASLEIYL